MEIFPQIGVKIKNLWNHHLALPTTDIFRATSLTTITFHNPPHLFSQDRTLYLAISKVTNLRCVLDGAPRFSMALCVAPKWASMTLKEMGNWDEITVTRVN